MFIFYRRVLFAGNISKKLSPRIIEKEKVENVTIDKVSIVKLNVTI